MKALEVFHPFFMTRVLGCPIPTADLHIVMACREFCRRTSAWKEWLDPVTFDGTRATFDHDLTSRQEIFRYTRAVLNDSTEDDYNIVSRSALPADWDAGTNTLLDRTVVHIDAAQFMVFPTPVDGDTLRMEAVFLPKNGSTQVADVLYDRYAKAIADGTAALLLAIPNMPWTNEKHAGHHTGLFEAAIKSAANDGFAQRKVKRVRKAPL